MILTPNLGSTIGYIFPCLYVTSDNSNFETYLIILAFYYSIALPFAIFGTADRPPTPPSFSSQ
jgi:hypothetical protein